MDYITKPSITRLARRAGVKSISEECYAVIHEAIGTEIENIISAALIINSEHSTKTLMVDDIRDAFHIKGYNIASSSDLGMVTCSR